MAKLYMKISCRLWQSFTCLASAVATCIIITLLGFEASRKQCLCVLQVKCPCIILSILSSLLLIDSISSSVIMDSCYRGRIWSHSFALNSSKTTTAHRFRRKPHGWWSLCAFCLDFNDTDKRLMPVVIDLGVFTAAALCLCGRKCNERAIDAGDVDFDVFSVVFQICFLWLHLQRCFSLDGLHPVKST